MKQSFRCMYKCICLALVLSIASLSTIQTVWGTELTGVQNQGTSLTFVEKQPLTDEELMSWNTSTEVDMITAGHRPGHRPVPVPSGRVYASDILFWAGFSLIMLSIAVYPY